MREILSYLWSPGLLLGGLMGFVLLLLGHWVWPNLSSAIGAVVVVVCGVGGMVLENLGGTRHMR